MNKPISLLKSDVETREKVLDKLGYSVNDEGYVLYKRSGENLFCRYSEEPVHIDTAAILPGSIIIINANILTMSQYFLDYGA